jgi:hypothetical protein
VLAAAMLNHHVSRRLAIIFQRVKRSTAWSGIAVREEATSKRSPEGK